MKTTLAALALIVFVSGCDPIWTERTQLVEEINAVHDGTERELAEGWVKVAHGYLTDYEIGQLDQLLATVAEDPYSRWNYGAVAGRTASYIRSVVEERLASEGDYPITETKISARLMSDNKIALLDALGEANYELLLIQIKVEDAQKSKELDDLRTAFEAKKTAVESLLDRQKTS